MDNLRLVNEMFGNLRTMIGEVIAILTEISTSSVRPQEELSVTVQAATKVYCVHCRLHIYYLKNKKGGVSVANLAPLHGGQVPGNFDCPACGQDIRAYAPEPTLRTDKGYWRS